MTLTDGRGVDVVIALDFSKSMLARDVRRALGGSAWLPVIFFLLSIPVAFLSTVAAVACSMTS